MFLSRPRTTFSIAEPDDCRGFGCGAIRSSQRNAAFQAWPISPSVDCTGCGKSRAASSRHSVHGESSQCTEAHLSAKNPFRSTSLGTPISRLAGWNRRDANRGIGVPRGAASNANNLCENTTRQSGGASDEIPQSCAGIPVPFAGHHFPRPRLYFGGWTAHAGGVPHGPPGLGLGHRHLHAFLRRI